MIFPPAPVGKHVITTMRLMPSPVRQAVAKKNFRPTSAVLITCHVGLADAMADATAPVDAVAVNAPQLILATTNIYLQELVRVQKKNTFWSLD